MQFVISGITVPWWRFGLAVIFVIIYFKFKKK